MIDKNTKRYNCKSFFITLIAVAFLLILSVFTAYDFSFSFLINYRILLAVVIYAILFSTVLIPLGFMELLRGDKISLRRKAILFLVLYVGTLVYSFLLLYIADRQALNLQTLLLNLVYVGLLIMEPNVLD